MTYNVSGTWNVELKGGFVYDNSLYTAWSVYYAVCVTATCRLHNLSSCMQLSVLLLQ